MLLTVCSNNSGLPVGLSVQCKMKIKVCTTYDSPFQGLACTTLVHASTACCPCRDRAVVSQGLDWRSRHALHEPHNALTTNCTSCQPSLPNEAIRSAVFKFPPAQGVVVRTADRFPSPATGFVDSARNRRSRWEDLGRGLPSVGARTLQRSQSSSS
jgi:hypothetical protein